MRWRTGHNYGMSDDDDTFFPETTTVRTGEESATVTAGGDGIALQPGPWGEEHLHWTLPILMGVVGLSRSDLATAASSPLQPPSVGQDWELPAQPSVNMAMGSPASLSSHSHNPCSHPHNPRTTTHLNTPPNRSFSIVVVVSMGEGEEEIVGTDVRRRLGQPLYTGHCTDVTWALQAAC
jgi:hypothetical protein